MSIIINNINYLLKLKNMLRSKQYTLLFNIILFIAFDKCERCRKSPATIECLECGT